MTKEDLIKEGAELLYQTILFKDYKHARKLAFAKKDEIHNLLSKYFGMNYIDSFNAIFDKYYELYRKEENHE